VLKEYHFSLKKFSVLGSQSNPLPITVRFVREWKD
jgi:hypothetical protein